MDGKPVDFCLRKQGDGGTDCGGPGRWDVVAKRTPPKQTNHRNDQSTDPHIHHPPSVPQPAALAFCQAMGFKTAPSFLLRSDFPEETLFLGDRQMHTAASRAGWQYIECGY